MGKKSLFFAIALAVIGASALAGAESANATSVYDDTVTLTENLYLHSTGSGYTLPTECSSMPTVSLNTRWAEFISELSTDGLIDFGDNAEISMNYSFNGTTSASAYSAWQNKTKWVVSQYTRENPYGYSNQISITWTDTEPVDAAFAYVGGDNRLVVTNSTNVYQMNITFDGSTDCTLEANTTFNSSVGSSTSIFNPVLAWQGTTDPWKIFFANWDITYPSDYEGVEPPDVAPVPAVESDWTPDMYVSVATDWKATFYDQNFFTFDQVPFLCSDELAPALHIEIWDRSADPEVLIQTGAFSANAEWTYQFEKKPTSNDYRIVAWYECGEEPIFTDSSFYDFTINGVGSLVTTSVQNCLTEAFPFFDYDACIASMNDTLALLTFQMSNPVNEGVLGMSTANPNSCHTMGTLGSWINRPGQTLCPAFSEAVRNTITPFITFALAGIVFYYISRGARQVI